jgi:choline dehydrogenase-like flavoprotein
LKAARRATLQSVVATLAPPDARFDRVGTLAADALDALTPGRRADLERLLDLMWLPMRAPSYESRAGTLLLFAHSPIALLRSGFAALKRLVLYLAYAESDASLPPNPIWARIGYPGPRSDGGANDPALPFAQARDGERIRADVVVIGSGAGGGVAASAFARAGKTVIVLEAGGAYDANAVTQRELAMSELYLDAGLTATKDLGLTILAGATVGGGTAVNWCTSFRLPDRITDEWQSESGIASLGTELYPYYDALEATLELAPAARHNRNNACIVEGARALGLHVDAMPRNAPPNCGDGCGYCGFGCAYGKKRSTARVFLPDVAATGGRIYARARAVTIDLAGARARSVRVEQTVAPSDVRRFNVEADLVVVAAGTLRTPGLLARSGIRHPSLGKRLFLHPVSALLCAYDDPIDAHEGPMQSAYSDAFAWLDGNYGAKIEAAPAHPGLAALVTPWEGRTRHAAFMDRMRYAAAMIAVTRDRDPGAIDLDDEAAIRYSVSPFDGEHLLAGLAGMADLAFAGGATEIATLHTTPIRITREEWNAARRARFVEDLQRRGIASNRQPFFSAHQMGTAPIGSRPADAVVDPSGRVWGYENLLVADASLFPQASGVNPMLTIMALAKYVAAQHGGVTEARDATIAV